MGGFYDYLDRNWEIEAETFRDRTTTAAPTPRPMTGDSQSSPAEMGNELCTEVGRRGFCIPSERDWSEVNEARI